MNSSSESLFSLASKRLHWLASRQKVVAENIANADTGGFTAGDTQSFESYIKSTSESKTPPAVKILKAVDVWGSSLSGNNVILEEQMILAADNASQYRLASNLYRKAHQLVLAAAGSR
jgi:flagellar basal-body rod protein FlgB